MGMPRKLRCEVENIQNHGGGVYTVDLIPQNLAPRFLPGQFLHLALDEYDPTNYWPDSRVFSIASAPSERERLRISYSVVGRFTTRMESELRGGKTVWVKLPYGDFMVKGERDVVLFAGGTGITAFTAFISSLTVDYPHSVILFYGARKQELLLYREIIDDCTLRNPKFNVHYFLEEPSVNPEKGMVAEIGRLSVPRVLPVLRDPLATDYYLSGPPAMLETITAGLMAKSVPASAIKSDAWA
jgi:ferredoxin-NADP reductase